MSRQVSLLRAKLLERDREVEVLHARLADLRQVVLGGATLPPPQWGLTRGEAALVGLMINKDLASRQDCETLVREALQGGDARSVKVMISRARRKLAPFGVTITTAYGLGYAIPAERRAALRADLGFPSSKRA